MVLGSNHMDLIHSASTKGSIEFCNNSEHACLVTLPSSDTYLEGFIASKGYTHIDTLDQLSPVTFICIVTDGVEG